MSALGGLFLITVILLGMMFSGFYFLMTEVLDRFKKRNGSKEDAEHLTLVLNALAREGFFNASATPTSISNKVLSEVLSEASKREGFFWNLSKKGIHIKDNPFDDGYDHLLVYGNNSIGFHWRGRL